MARKVVGNFSGVLVALGFALAACGVAGSGADLELAPRDSLAIINGSTPTQPGDAAVGALLLTTTSASGQVTAQAFCSGTLIGERLFLTAGHCILPELNAQTGLVFFGDELRAPLATYGEVVGIVSAEQHPSYLAGSETNDIALIELAAMPTGIAPLPPLPAGQGLSRADEGGSARIVGFGLTEAPFFGNGSFAMERKLEVSVPIVLVCNGPASCSGLPPRSFAYDHANGGACSGDSGGAALVRRGNTEYVAGVTSTISAPLWRGTQQADCPNAAAGVETAVDGFWPFLESFLTARGMVVDPCADGLDDCDPAGGCNPHLGGFTCAPCPAGYADPRADGTLCTDIDECALGSAGCDDLAGCINVAGGYTCGACPAGYDDTNGDGTECTDVDECAASPCDPAVPCNNSPGSFSCGACPAGTFDLHGDGSECSAAAVAMGATSQALAVEVPSDLVGSVSCNGSGGAPLWLALLLPILWRRRRP